MGRMHSKGKGMSASAIPYRRMPPQWAKREAEELCDHICKLSKKGLTPSQIGVLLRDREGVAQVKGVTGNKILRILKSNGVPTLSVAPKDPARRLTCTPHRRHGTGAAGGPVPPYQEGCLRAQALGAQPERPRRQVPPYSDREPYPPPRPVLPAGEEAAPELEIPVRHRFYARRLVVSAI
jgi:hypothetical protein